MKDKTLKDMEIITNFIEKNKENMTSEEAKTFREISKLLPEAMEILNEQEKN